MAKPAGRLSDLDACPLPGHGSNPTTTGSANVLINGLPALRVGDSTACGDAVTQGIGSILVNGMPIAHLGSATAHGGAIITGSGDVLVGNQHNATAFIPPTPILANSEQYQLLDEISGQPVAGMLYCIEAADGQRLVGHTDQSGNTERVCSREPASIMVRWGRQAAAHLRALGISY